MEAHEPYSNNHTNIQQATFTHLRRISFVQRAERVERVEGVERMEEVERVERA